MAREIERQYLVVSEEWRNKVTTSSEITQGYLSVDPERTVRIRIREGRPSKLTVKGPNEGPVRVEYEYEIPDDDARQMLDLCIEPTIHKTRNLVEYGSYTWEVDEFDGANSGLVLAEVEVSEGAVSPPTPEWLGDDVTGDDRFYNSNLVAHPYEQWQQDH